jgi:ubiquinone/menaquinone biosynthesis C-methylase UbiE
MSERPEDSYHNREAELEEKEFRGYVEDMELNPDDFEKDILDVGASSGRFARWAREHGVSNKIVSLDEHLRYGNPPNWVAGRAEALPFKDNSFDLVLCRFSVPVMYASDYKAGLVDSIPESVISNIDEEVRVVRKGGAIKIIGSGEDKEDPYKNHTFTVMKHKLEELHKQGKINYTLKPLPVNPDAIHIQPYLVIIEKC